MGALRLWTLLGGTPALAAKLAARAETAGWHGLGLTDSQNIAGDVWVALTAAALSSTRLELGTCVTNPVTRHPAVTASAALGVAALAGPRVHVGIGRGDSALAHLGRAPAPVPLLERYAVAVRSYLRGIAVDFRDLGFTELQSPPVATLGLTDTPDASQLVHATGSDPLIPVEVAASGPKVIAAAARSADRVIFAVGADPRRLEWAIMIARNARADAGLDPDTLRLGAYLNMASHPNINVARQLVAGSLATTARFSAMHGTVNGPVTDTDRTILEKLGGSYDMRHHMQAESKATSVLSEDFIDRTAVIGPPEQCIERLRTIAHLGIDRIVIIGPSPGSNRGDAATASNLAVNEILPAFAIEST